MADRVAVYIDFDNVVISRYDHVHGRGAWRKDDARSHAMDIAPEDELGTRLSDAKVALAAIIDYATSFGVVAMTRAYADWSVPANAAYRRDLVDRAVDLVQLFPASGTKNGADIRLAVDAVEDLARHADITHVVVVAGDSDYIPLAQRCRRLGRTVVGIAVAGSTSQAFVSACDEFARYEELPGVKPRTVESALPELATKAKKTSAPPTPTRKTSSTTTPVKKPAAKKAPAKKAAPVESPALGRATELLVRAVRLGLQKSDDDWVYAAGVKSQMQRLDPAFKEKTLGFSTFRDFVTSREMHVESKVVQNGQLLRLRQ
ncbi:NYN domain-containing protein [Microvirga sp. 0TCS3.31]